MDTQLKYREIIKKVLQDQANYRASLPDAYTSQVLFDDERGQYLGLAEKETKQKVVGKEEGDNTLTVY